MDTAQQIKYSALVLDEASANSISRLFPQPNGWTWKGHHMTICLGPLPAQRQQLKGSCRRILATHFGKSEKAMALKVRDGGMSLNPIPHVTLAVSPNGAAVDSNAIEYWEPLTSSITLSGTVIEIPSLF